MPRAARMIPAMSLGTKNRLLQNANACKDHLRAAFRDRAALVEEFIAEIEGPAADPAAWSRFTDLKRSRSEMLERAEAAFRDWLG